MDQDLKREVLDVRKVIEKSTSKVSLRDLEKKGFRQVKVLRAGDINQLIFKAVQNVLAKQPRGAGMSDEERQKIMREAKAELDRQMAEKKALMGKQGEIQQAHQNLQAKLQEVNKQLAAEKQAFLAEKQQFTRDKQALMEKSLDGQKTAAANYTAQIEDLKARLTAAEGGVSREEYEQVRRRMGAQVDDLQEDVERYRKKGRELTDDNDRLQSEVSKLKRELEEGGGASGSGKVHDAEFQRLRMEMEQRQARMQEMMAGIASSLVNAKGGGGGGVDMTAQFKKLQQDISSAVRKASGRGGDEMVDLTAEQAAALFANSLEDNVIVESNLKNIKVKEQQAAGVSDKLAKLRNLRRK